MFFIDEPEDKKSGENRIKKILKRYPTLFNLVRFVASPVLKYFSYSAKDFAREFPGGSLVVSVGSGSAKTSDRVVNIDIVPFENVDIVSYAHQIPFKDGSVDGIVAEVLLEHVENVGEVINEFHRVLRPGGKVYVTAPFLYPFHAVPGDYNRWTISGLKLLFSAFKVERVEVYAGPVTTVVLSIAYFLALPFSIIGVTFSEYVAYLFLVLLFPLKFLDPLFRKLPGAHYSASIFSAVFEK